jgi:hypothetical protein
MFEIELKPFDVSMMTTEWIAENNEKIFFVLVNDEIVLTVLGEVLWLGKEYDPPRYNFWLKHPSPLEYVDIDDIEAISDPVEFSYKMKNEV